VKSSDQIRSAHMHHSKQCFTLVPPVQYRMIFTAEPA